MNLILELNENINGIIKENSKILNQAYSGQIKFKYAELTVRIKNTLEVLYIGKKGVGVNKVKEYISNIKSFFLFFQNDLFGQKHVF